MYNSQISSSRIISLLEKNGFRGSVVSINRVREVQTQLENLFSQGQLDETFVGERLKIFDFDISLIMERAKSIIIATTGQPIIQAGFRYRAKIYKVIIPPTYTDITDRLAARLLRKILGPEGFTLKEVALSEKLLLVMSGIVEEMVRFHRPVSFITDLELDETKWGSAELHEKCIKCKACINACPTKAISKDKFLISAEKCLTYFNERSNPFPEWINSEWHNCIIGCMVCQNICPINREYLDHINNTVVFSEKETTNILGNTAITELSGSTIHKLKKIGLFDDYNLLSRNLSVLIHKAN